jgi:hypothetical protein
MWSSIERLVREARKTKQGRNTELCTEIPSVLPMLTRTVKKYEGFALGGDAGSLLSTEDLSILANMVNAGQIGFFLLAVMSLPGSPAILGQFSNRHHRHEIL